MQLRGGIIPEAGTVAYCVNGEWKAICHTNWDYKDAFVVCRQLGYPATGIITAVHSVVYRFKEKLIIKVHCFIELHTLEILSTTRDCTSTVLEMSHLSSAVNTFLLHHATV